ncbi:hypothetical protein V8C37DRAFT_405770 [Trichoderma ceciliae]
MKLYSALFATVALSSAAEACKCWARGRQISEYTHACCTYTGGVFSRDNCDGDIFDKLGTFSKCCKILGSRTDCDCETCPQEDARREALGLAPMTDAERAAFSEKKNEKNQVRGFVG